MSTIPTQLRLDVGELVSGHCFQIAADELASEHRALLERGVQHSRQRDIDAVERLAGLRQLAELAGPHGEEAGGPGLLDGDVDRADPGIVHAGEAFQVAAGIQRQAKWSVEGRFVGRPAVAEKPAREETKPIENPKV